MSTLTLYHSPTSPYVRKVMIVLHETGQIGDVSIAPAQGTPLDSSKMPLSQNPLGKVPVLARPDGPALFDSRTICRYLDARAGAYLYPEGEALWSALTIEALAEGMLDAAVLMTYESRLRPQEMRSAAVLDGLWAKIDRSVEALESRWLSNLAGPFGIAQISVGTALGYLDLRHDARCWRNSAAALASWYTGIAARPSFTGTVPPEGS